jgi:hypothetical protein
MVLFFCSPKKWISRKNYILERLYIYKYILCGSFCYQYLTPGGVCNDYQLIENGLVFCSPKKWISRKNYILERLYIGRYILCVLFCYQYLNATEHVVKIANVVGLFQKHFISNKNISERLYIGRKIIIDINYVPSGLYILQLTHKCQSIFFVLI